MLMAVGPVSVKLCSRCPRSASSPGLEKGFDSREKTAQALQVARSYSPYPHRLALVGLRCWTTSDRAVHYFCSTPLVGRAPSNC